MMRTLNSLSLSLRWKTERVSQSPKKNQISHNLNLPKSKTKNSYFEEETHKFYAHYYY